MTSGLHLFMRQCYREILLYCREPRQLVHSCVFLLMILIFFPLTMFAEMSFLRQVAPGLVWIGVLFVFFLSSERLFQQDYEDGVIEQWLVSGYSLTLLISAKMLIQWLLNLIPLILLTPLMGIFLNLTTHEVFSLIWSFLVATPALFLLCALAASFNAGIKQKGILMALILFPLTIPIMIFGSSTLNAAMHGQNIDGYLALLAAFSTLAIGLIPFSVGFVVELCLSE